jgi:hypothetical protein
LARVSYSTETAAETAAETAVKTRPASPASMPQGPIAITNTHAVGIAHARDAAR